MTDDYVTYFINSAMASGDPHAALTLLLLFMGRFLPIIALSPFLGARVLPHPVKVTFALSMFAVFLPKLLDVTTTPLTFNTTAMVLLVKELFIGTCLGFVMGVPFMIVQSAGIIIDHQRGGASLMVNDPTIQNQSSPIGTFLNMMMILIFFAIDGPFLFIDIITRSYEVVPPDRMLTGALFTNNAFWKIMLTILGDTMRISLQLCAPALIAILMTDVFLGIANRLAPQVQITFLGIALKSLIGLGIFTFGWTLLIQAMTKQGYVWLRQVETMVVIMGNLLGPATPP